MKIVIIGGGVVGVSSAYALARRGHDITLLESSSRVGEQTSYANGGQLSYTQVEPIANAYLWRQLPRLLLGRDPAFRITHLFDSTLLRWAVQFLRACHSQQERTTIANMLRLGLYTQTVTAQYMAQTEIQFHHRHSGKLCIFQCPKAWQESIKRKTIKNQNGASVQSLNAEECVAIEPQLAHKQSQLVGGLYAKIDECGDSHLFCQALAHYCQKKYTMQLIYDCPVTGWQLHNNRIQAVTSHSDHFAADYFILCAGIDSVSLARLLGIRLPIYPLKGYSITLPAQSGAPQTSITDMQAKVVFSLLGNHLRIAGIAELAGYNKIIDKHRVEQLRQAGEKLFPQAADYTADPHGWCGLRPYTPDSAPIIGESPYTNLFFNTGHGMLGWTLACGCAEITADLVEHRTPAIGLDGLTLARF